MQVENSLKKLNRERSDRERLQKQYNLLFLIVFILISFLDW